MRYKFCPKCRKAYIKSRLEGDRCIYCNGECETLEVKRNGLYFFGYAMMVLGAISAFVPRFMEVTGDSFFVWFGIALVVAGSVFVVVASTAMAKKAVRMAIAENDSEE